jgi:general secretion pathway protein A
MYFKYFKLKEEPFATAPDPRFLYRGVKHQEALERLISAVTLRRGITAIIAEPGLGKSTLIRTLLSGLRESVHFAWAFNTTMDAKELLRFICRDFGFVPNGNDKSDLLIELYTFFIREFKDGRIPLLIIDEAQNLQPGVLEEIRQLSNLETANQKLVQIILSGQPQLDAYLDLPELNQLKQRIAFKASLARFDLAETTAYIQHRLNVAGAKSDDILSVSALKNVHEISGGIPRLINQICDNAMMVAAQRKQPQIDAMLVRELLDKGAVMKAPAFPVIEREPMPAFNSFLPKAKTFAAPVEQSMPAALPSIAEQSSADQPIRTTKKELRSRVIIDKNDLFEAIDIAELISVI